MYKIIIVRRTYPLVTVWRESRLTKRKTLCFALFFLPSMSVTPRTKQSLLGDNYCVVPTSSSMRHSTSFPERMLTSAVFLISSMDASRFFT